MPRSEASGCRLVFVWPVPAVLLDRNEILIFFFPLFVFLFCVFFDPVVFFDL